MSVHDIAQSVLAGARAGKHAQWL